MNIKSISTLFAVLVSFGIYATLSFVSPTPVNAQTCTWSNWSCNGDTSGCNIVYSADPQSVSCSPQGANSCPSPLVGSRCDHGGYTHKQFICRNPLAPGGNYRCEPANYNIGAGFCGCSNTGGGPPPPPPPVCPSICGCINVTSQGVDGCWCERGGWQGPGSCTNNTSCPAGCGGTSCTPSNCSCVAPGVVTITAPPNNAQVQYQSVIRWTLGGSSGANSNWGTDGGQTGCGSSCTYSGSGTFKLLVNNINHSDKCLEGVGTGSSAYIPSGVRTCTLVRFDPSWPSTTINVRITAANSGCESSSANISYTVPQNQKPYCSTLTVSGGRMANGLLGVDKYENITIRGNAGETDLLGPPSQVRVCYALRGQPISFYRQGLSSWACFNGQPGAVFTETTTLDAMIRAYQPTTATTPSNLANAIEQHGFVLAMNTSDNVETNRFCSNNVGYNNGNGIYWPDQTGCNGGTCTFNIYNNSPSITSVSPTGTTYIGTSPDTDNGMSCVDNNPMTYSMEVSDPDGSADIDYLQFNLASNANLLNPDPSYVGMRRWELRVQFVKNDYPNANMFVVRDTDPITGDFCYRSNRVLEPKGASNNYCFNQSDRHNSAVAGNVLNTTYNGVNVDIYYLQSDIFAYTGGYQVRLKGGSNWSTNSFAAYERNGNRVWSNFVIQYLDNGTQMWDGDYNQVWYVRDAVGVDAVGVGEDKIDNGPLDTIINVDNRNAHHQIGRSIVDLTPPVIVLNDPYPVSADEMSVDWIANDPTSRLSRVYGEASFNQPNPRPNPVITPFPIYNSSATSDPQTPPYIFTNQNTWYNLLNDTAVGSEYLWNIRNINNVNASRSEVINIGFNDRGAFEYDIYAEDRSCNLSTTSIEEIVYLPWIISRGGHVFSARGSAVAITNFAPADYLDALSPEFVNYPFNITKGEVELSSEWLGFTTLLGSQIINQTRSGVYGSGAYQDGNNIDGYWITELNRKLDYEMRVDPDSYDEIVTIGTLSGNISTICPDGNKYCIINSTSADIPNSGLICDRKTIIYLTGDLLIDGEIRIPSGDKSNGCIFMVEGNVDIQDGNHASAGLPYTAPPRYDTIEAFIITNGRILIEEVDLTQQVRDGLKVHGSLIAFGNNGGLRSIQLNRSLKLLDNYNYPTIVVHHDMRYVTLAREMYGGDNETYKQEIGFKPL